jgi:phage terminase small subunit
MRKSVLTPQERADSREPSYSAPLTPRQRKVAQLVGRGDSWNSAALKAGYSQGASNVSAWKNDPRMQQLVLAEQRRNEASVEMTRKKVMDGFLEAIDQARVQADPATMIKGWTEVARMCGYYAPDAKKIEISISAKRLVDKFETMSDEELLKYAEKDILDVAFTEKGADEAPQEALPAVQD